VGSPAEDLPQQLLLLKNFTIETVPKAEPADVDKYNLIYKPFSKRSFLRQYLDWLMMKTRDPGCSWFSRVFVSSKFNNSTQKYTTSLEYDISDSCQLPCSYCQFLQAKTVKPEAVFCSIMMLLCDVKGKFGLCQTGDEAMLLQQYLLLTDNVHYPMLIPQPSLLTGKRRPDFISFIPITKYQYHKVAILVDRPGKNQVAIQNEDSDYDDLGYRVKRVLIDGNMSYFKLARELKNWFQSNI
jgi:hypothetical protein